MSRTDVLYFRVKKAIKIANHRFLPCVSYTLSKDLVKTVELLESKGEAEISEKPFVFESGKVVGRK